MVLSKLSSGLQSIIEQIRGSTIVDKRVVRQLTKELQKTLILADVNIKQVFEFTKSIEEKALDENLPSGINRKEHLIKVLYEKIAELMGSKLKSFHIDPQKQNIILLVGIQGCGKTTTCAKIAHLLKKRGFKPALICADTFRAGAFEQLKQLGAELNIPVYGEEKTKNACDIAKHGIEKYKTYNAIIVDSEGRHSLDHKLMDDLNKLEKAINPTYTLLVLDSTIGQQAASQALAFREKCNINGIILTKLDGSSKGGGCLSACSAIKVPVFFIGTGEHLDDIEEFNAARFTSRLLGFGDVEGLLKRFEESVEKDKVEQIASRITAGRFTLIDLYEQLQQMQKLGSIDKIVEMLPIKLPFGKLPKEKLEEQQKNLKKFKYIMDSMTPEELETAKLDRKRIERIAAGSGTSIEDVKALIHQYNQMRGMIKRFGKDRRFARMLKNFGS